MIVVHLSRSQAKLVDLVARHFSNAASFIMTRPALGGADQPFCGAEMRMSTPLFSMSTQTQPEGDAIEHEQAADLMHGVGDGADIVVGQDHAARGLDMRGEDHVGLSRP